MAAKNIELEDKIEVLKERVDMLENIGVASEIWINGNQRMKMKIYKRFFAAYALL